MLATLLLQAKDPSEKEVLLSKGERIDPRGKE
jgi:hypothetical protein